MSAEKIDELDAKKLVSKERNARIYEYIQKHILEENILRVLKLGLENSDVSVKKLPYAQSYDFIDKLFGESEENKKDVLVYYSFASSNNQKHISQIMQSSILSKEYQQYNKLYNYDEYVRVDDLLKVDVKQNIPILFTVFVNKRIPELKEYGLKLVNNLKFNEN